MLELFAQFFRDFSKLCAERLKDLGIDWVPSWGVGLIAFLILFLAFKFTQKALRMWSVLIGLLVFGVAVWWHYNMR